MREIRFRAWDGKRMMAEVFPTSESTVGKWLGDPNVEMNFYDLGGIVQIMQYTGLKDKNGKEIYEGDLIRYSDGIQKVEWVGGEWGYRNVMWANKGEIIGNIHENPELFK